MCWSQCSKPRRIPYIWNCWHSHLPPLLPIQAATEMVKRLTKSKNTAEHIPEPCTCAPKSEGCQSAKKKQSTGPSPQPNRRGMAGQLRDVFFPQTGLPVLGFLLLSKGCILGPHDFAFVSGLAFHSGCSGPHDFTLVSHTCLPYFSHSGCFEPHDFTLVFHLSPTLVSHSGCSRPHAFTFVSQLSPSLVFHSGCSGPRDFFTCLPLWVVWAAWFYICLPLVFTLDGKYVAIRFMPASVSRCSIGLFYICLGSTVV